MRTPVSAIVAASPGCSPGHDRRRGAALIVGLILLMLLTVLAVTGAGTAAIELIMAGNEQFRQSASYAAAAGIEAAIAELATVPAAPGAEPVILGGVRIGPSSQDTYSTSTRFVGEEHGLPQSSANKLVGLHYVIESTGTSARGATETQEQGVLIVAPASGAQTQPGRIGAGLDQG